MATLRECGSDDLGAGELAQLMDLFRKSWPDGDFSDDDAAHSFGGRHFLAEVDGRIASHASVVPRTLRLDGRPLRAGYVEAVATLPRFRRQGLASTLMAAANAHIHATYELGALSTGEHRLYERAGWRRWAGETWVRERDGTMTRTPDDDDGLMVLLTPQSPSMTLREALACEWRPGDAW
jgi:aminoglycoside 2'-N-acetyltransferase I